MPNWVRNKVKFSNRGKEILDKVIVVNGDKEELTAEDVLFDFNKILEMPKTLNLVSGSEIAPAIQYALKKMSKEDVASITEKLHNIPVSFDGNYYNRIFHKVYTSKELDKIDEDFREDLAKSNSKLYNSYDYQELGIENLEDLGNICINNIMQYRADTWYDWCIENWGTKWNACNTYVISDNDVEFDTAWSCPVNIFIELSKQFSDVEIEVEYADEDIGYNCGRFVFSNGNIEECIDMDSNTDFALDVWGYTEEMKEEYYEEMED